METENRLIAEFMGIDTAFDGRFSINPITKYGGWELMVYHSDWNWLMEVVEKIESLGYIVSTHFNSTDIKDLDTSETICYNRGSWKQYTPQLTKIESVYNACLEFIKWYNKQNQ